VQPIVGYLERSDVGGLGVGSPIFLTGAILASLALIADAQLGTVWMAAGLLWILDASVNVTMEPFRAFVGDLLPTEQRKTGLPCKVCSSASERLLSSGCPTCSPTGSA